MFQLKKIFTKVLTLGIAFSVLTSISFAGSVTATPKATATLAASCTISAQNVVFGQINPQTSSSGVSSSSTMSLFCSRGAAYSVGLMGGNTTYTLDGDVLGVAYSCPNNCAGVPTNYHYFLIYPAGVDYTTNPNGYTSRVLYPNGTVVQNMNILKGSASGDTISYKITLPGDDTKIWNRGNYNYTSTGTGATQSVTVKATLKTTNYPTPDYYSDTMTAVVTF